MSTRKYEVLASKIIFLRLLPFAMLFKTGFGFNLNSLSCDHLIARQHIRMRHIYMVFKLKVRETILLAKLDKKVISNESLNIEPYNLQ